MARNSSALIGVGELLTLVIACESLCAASGSRPVRIGVAFIDPPVGVLQGGPARGRQLVVQPVVQLDHQPGVLLRDRAQRDLLRLITDEHAGRR
jgi:hypothetical protein